MLRVRIATPHIHTFTYLRRAKNLRVFAVLERTSTKGRETGRQYDDLATNVCLRSNVSVGALSSRCEYLPSS